MKYTMSEKEIMKAVLIQGAIDGTYTVEYLAKRLDVTERRIKQMKKAVRENGARTHSRQFGKASRPAAAPDRAFNSGIPRGVAQVALTLRNNCRFTFR
jgi:transposase